MSPKRELMERFGMSHPIDQIDNPRTKPLQMVRDGQMSSGQSQSDVPLEGFLLREILSERRGDRYRRNPPARGVRPR